MGLSLNMGVGFIYLCFGYALLSQLHNAGYARVDYYLLRNPYLQVTLEVLAFLIYICI